MATTILQPCSIYANDLSGRCFPNNHVATIATLNAAAVIKGLGVKASLDADTVWALAFQMPMQLPSGTLKFLLNIFSNASSGAARINPKWCAVSAGSNPFNASLVAEGVTPDALAGAAGSGDTVTFGSSDNDQLIQAKWILNATTAPTPSQLLNMALTFETSGWTLVHVLTVQPFLIWE